MISRNSNVVTALFESYINMRVSDWKLDLTNPQLDANRRNKVDICLESIANLDAQKNQQFWVSYFHQSLKHAKDQIEKAKDSRNFFFGLGSWFVGKPLMVETLCAVMSYIYANLERENKEGDKLTPIPDKDVIAFKELLDDLRLMNDHNANLDSYRYHEYHFEHVIKKQDKVSLPVELQKADSSFDDFEEYHSRNRNRSLIVQKLRESLQASKAEAKSDASSSTSKIAAAGLVSPQAERAGEWVQPSHHRTKGKRSVVVTRAQRKAAQITEPPCTPNNSPAPSTVATLRPN